MSFFVSPLCMQAGSSALYSNKPQVLDREAKALLITDFAVSLLLITVGVLVILNLKYGIDLGALSGLGSIGRDAAYAMIGVGVGIVGLDILQLIIQQRRHINELHRLTTTEILFLVNKVETLEAREADLDLKLKTAEDFNSNAEAHIQKANRERNAAFTDRLETSNALLCTQKIAAQVPLPNNQIVILKETIQSLQLAREQSRPVEASSNPFIEGESSEQEEMNKKVGELESALAKKLQQLHTLEEEKRAFAERLGQLQEGLSKLQLQIDEEHATKAEADEQREKINEALIFKPAEEVVYDLSKLDLSKLGDQDKETIHNSLDTDGTIEETIQLLNALREAVIVSANDLLRADLSQNHRGRIGALVEHANDLKSWLSSINSAGIPFTTMFNN